jgi:pyruvate kinase
MNRVKIVATIGPRTSDREMLLRLRAAGMDVARLNGSHADPDWHAATITRIRETIPDVPVLFDVPGRKIRTGRLERPIVLESGSDIVLTTEPGYEGAGKVSVTYGSLHEDVAPDDAVLMDDGNLRLVVRAVRGRDIICRAENAGTLTSSKGVHVPGVELRVDFLSDRDRRLIDFARKSDVDFIGVSFVDTAANVDAVRDLVGGGSPRLVAKVETRSALERMDEVIAAADALMVDRGDLSAETNLERVALSQKKVLAAARRAGKPVIVATEMLHSMIESRYPTKAEVSDITNAVIDGADALMLSGETAVGRYPDEAVAVMRRIADEVVRDQQETLDREADRALRIPEVIGEAIALICRRTDVTKIVAVTLSGYAARMVASQMPRQPILAVSNDRVAARSFNLNRGTTGYFVDVPFSRTAMDHVPRCLEALWHRGAIVADDLIVVTAVGYPRSGNRMNLIEMHRGADLRDTFGWTPAIAQP